MKYVSEKGQNCIGCDEFESQMDFDEGCSAVMDE